MHKDLRQNPMYRQQVEQSFRQRRDTVIEQELAQEIREYS